MEQPNSTTNHGNLNYSSHLHLIQVCHLKNQQFQQEIKASNQNLKTQIRQLATSLSQIKSQGKLASQTVVNLRHNVSAITLIIDQELLEDPRQVRHGHAPKVE